MARFNWEHRNKMEKVASYGYFDSKTKPNNTKKSKKDKKGKQMKSKFDSKCVTCSKAIKAGTNIFYYFDLKKARHLNCKDILKD